MKITSEGNNGNLKMCIEGKIDTLTAPELNMAISSIPKDTTSLTLDMTNVNYVSSAGLRVLLSAQKQMNEIGSMKLINVREEVMEILEMTGFSDFLTIE